MDIFLKEEFDFDSLKNITEKDLVDMVRLAVFLHKTLLNRNEYIHTHFLLSDFLYKKLFYSLKPLNVYTGCEDWLAPHIAFRVASSC